MNTNYKTLKNIIILIACLFTTSSIYGQAKLIKELPKNIGKAVVTQGVKQLQKGNKTTYTGQNSVHNNHIMIQEQNVLRHSNDLLRKKKDSLLKEQEKYKKQIKNLEH